MVDDRADVLTVRREPARATILVLFFAVAFFASIILIGYGLNLLGWAANALSIFALVALLVLFCVASLRRQAFRVGGDPLELFGFALVTLGTWVYLVLPSVPTFLPPTYSVDAVRHVRFAQTIYATGRIIEDYPGGVALLNATIAHWVGVAPLRALHPLTALWLALTAGAVYALACVALPERRANKIVALGAGVALFASWDYFGGMLIAQQYFATQALAQLNVVAFALFLAEYRAMRARLWLFGLSFALLTISATFQLWLALPVALLGWTLFDQSRGAAFRPMARDFAIVVGIVAAFWIALVMGGGKFVPVLARVSADGNVAAPSFESLGGAWLILSAAGIGLARGLDDRAASARMFLWLAIAQTAVMLLLRQLGLATYWAYKSFYLLVLPLAVFSAGPVARVVAVAERVTRRAHPAVWFVLLGVVYLVLAGTIIKTHPPNPIELLDESDIQVALWARENLESRHINYISHKNIIANWLGAGLWNETYPADLFVDLATLGPKTYEEWRADPAWGKYLIVTHQQRLPLDPALRILYQRGESLIAQKPEPARALLAAAPRAYIGDVFALRDSAALPAQIYPGEILTVTLELETNRLPTQEVVWRFQLRDLENHSMAETRHAPFAGKFPLHRWPNGIALTQTLTMSVPLEIRPGLYDAQAGLYGVRTGAPMACEFSDGASDDVIHLGKIKIPVPQVSAHELAALTRVDAQIGDAFRLLGYRVRKTSPLRPGDSFDVVLYWHARARAANDYTVFAHLLDATGRLVAQRDSAPRAGTYPTTIWAQDEIVPDAYGLTIPRDARPGDYRVIVGMYQWQNLARVPVTDAAQRARGDHFALPIILQVTAN